MDWGAIAAQNGPLGIILFVLLTLYARKHIATGRELLQREEECEREREERNREREQHEREKAEIRVELKFWRDLAWSTSKMADHVIGNVPPTQDRV
jgi:hypothetical protein